MYCRVTKAALAGRQPSLIFSSNRALISPSNRNRVERLRLLHSQTFVSCTAFRGGKYATNRTGICAATAAAVRNVGSDRRRFVSTSSCLAATASSDPSPATKLAAAAAAAGEPTLPIQMIPLADGLNKFKDAQMYSWFSDATPVVKTQELLTQFHELTGFSWFTTVILSAVLVRTCVVLPLVIHQHYVYAKLETIHDEVDKKDKHEIAKEVQRLSETNGWNSKRMAREYGNRISRRTHELYEKYNCHPAKSLVIVLIQAPAWACLSTAWRNLVHMLPARDMDAQITCLEMKASGYLWLSDLTTPDATWTVPVILSLTNLALVRVNHTVRKGRKGFLSKILVFLLSTYALLMAYISSTVPLCISLYWLSSCAYGLAQNVALLSPEVRKFFRIPITGSTRQRPYRFLYNKVKSFVYFLKY